MSELVEFLQAHLGDDERSVRRLDMVTDCSPFPMPKHEGFREEWRP